VPSFSCFLFFPLESRKKRENDFSLKCHIRLDSEGRTWRYAAFNRPKSDFKKIRWWFWLTKYQHRLARTRSNNLKLTWGEQTMSSSLVWQFSN
jgi:hypothetical protein